MIRRLVRPRRLTRLLGLTAAVAIASAGNPRLLASAAERPSGPAIPSPSKPAGWSLDILYCDADRRPGQGHTRRHPSERRQPGTGCRESPGASLRGAHDEGQRGSDAGRHCAADTAVDRHRFGENARGAHRADETAPGQDHRIACLRWPGGGNDEELRRRRQDARAVVCSGRADPHDRDTQHSTRLRSLGCFADWPVEG